jgi:hypothetical protein
VYLEIGNVGGFFRLRGEKWSLDEERQLRMLVEEGKSSLEISRIMGKTRVSVKSKIFNLGLKSLKDATGVQGSVAAAAVVSSPEVPLIVPVSSSVASSVPVGVAGVDLKLPERLPSIEEKLKVLSAAVDALGQPGLSLAEVSRLHKIIQGVKVYQELFAKYVDYHGLEVEVLELRRQLASEIAKASNGASSKVSS